jgi:hypothetical protein
MLCTNTAAKTCVVEDSASIDVHGNQTNVSSGNSKEIHSFETFFYFQNNAGWQNHNPASK